MELITIPLYKALNYSGEKGRFVELELLEVMRKRGSWKGSRWMWMTVMIWATAERSAMKNLRRRLRRAC